MSEPARNHLVGFLFNALEHAEKAQVEEALVTDDSLCDDLQRIRSHLPTFEHDRQHHEPPPGLAARTCSWLAERLHDYPSSLSDPTRGSSGWAFSAAPFDASHDAAPLPKSPAVRAKSLAEQTLASRPLSLSPAARFGGIGWGEWRLRAPDMVVVAGILVCASFLFLPALAHCRFAAQTQLCQNNLKQVGVALMSYSDHHGGLFPQVPTSGNRAFAGVVGTILRDTDFLASPAALFCVTANRRTRVAIADYPTLQQIDRATSAMLPAIRVAASGDYGFSVGYWEQGKLALSRNQHRPWYAIAADAPSDSLPSHATANHAGRGQSVLFEDGHYQFLRRCCPRLSRDEFFLNNRGHVSPGIDANDAVILAGSLPLDTLPPES